MLDFKRGDIGTTAEGYARATIGGAPGFGVDAVTMNPYMGKDTLEPFITRALAEAKASWCWCGGYRKAVRILNRRRASRPDFNPLRRS